MNDIVAPASIRSSHETTDHGRIPVLDIGPFLAGEPGTYIYKAATSVHPREFSDSKEKLLSGAFIVDAPGAATDDQIFVIGIWSNFSAGADEEIAALTRLRVVVCLGKIAFDGFAVVCDRLSVRCLLEVYNTAVVVWVRVSRVEFDGLVGCGAYFGNHCMISQFQHFHRKNL